MCTTPSDFLGAFGHRRQSRDGDAASGREERVDFQRCFGNSFGNQLKRGSGAARTLCCALKVLGSRCDAPGADATSRPNKRMSDLGATLGIGGTFQADHEQAGLATENGEDFTLNRAIASRLARQVDEIDRAGGRAACCCLIGY
jgi:hypothetical protein